MQLRAYANRRSHFQLKHRRCRLLPSVIAACVNSRTEKPSHKTKMDDCPNLSGTPSAADVEESKRLWRVRKTIFQMLEDRGYMVAPHEINETLEEFEATFGNMPTKGHPDREALKHFAVHNVNVGALLAVMFHKGKIGIVDVRDVVHKLVEHGVLRVIFVISGTLTSAAKTYMSTPHQGVRIEAFLESELMYNVTHHHLVPKHIVLTSKMKEELMKRFDLDPTKMMVLLKTDPVARYFGLQTGQVVRIIRNSALSGHSVAYRIVE